VEQYGIADWTQLMTMLQQHGPQHLISRVRELEAGDPTGARWPRYKRSDDATAVLCFLS
jgi:hypothetical protein